MNKKIVNLAVIILGFLLFAFGSVILTGLSKLPSTSPIRLISLVIVSLLIIREGLRAIKKRTIFIFIAWGIGEKGYDAIIWGAIFMVIGMTVLSHGLIGYFFPLNKLLAYIPALIVMLTLSGGLVARGLIEIIFEGRRATFIRFKFNWKELSTDLKEVKWRRSKLGGIILILGGLITAVLFIIMWKLFLPIFT